MVRDRWLWGAVLVAVILRVAPMWIWPQVECVRDECIYRFLAIGIERNGVLGETTKGWLAAPGYPWMLVWFKAWFGSYFALKWLQIALSVSSVPVLYGITQRVTRSDSPAIQVRAARIAAFLLALHPTMAWYSNTWWIESIYIAFMLPAVWAVLIARDSAGRAWAWAFAAGLSLGVCVLFRGIATFLPPLFALALLWPDAGTSFREAARQRFRPALALILGAVLLVSPYSLYASRKYGGLVISDATVGHVLFLGNNDFPPLTFDYGNGVLTQPLYYRNLSLGRKFCDRRLPAAKGSRCEVRAATRWIAANPGEFVRRIPLRLAQQLNPNTFFTRHLRWGYWRGLPWFVKEALCLWIAATSVFVVIGGSIAGVARARGAFAVMAGGTIAYTMLAAAVMYGMSRFRLPLEPLWTVWLAWMLANAPGVADALRASRVRAIAVIVGVPLLGVGLAWFALTGFPMFWR